MEAIEAIMTRRSVRKFKDCPVAPSLVDTIVRAAFSAPSAGNQQPWHFLVIDDREILDKIPTAHPYAKMCLEAQAAIVVCAEPNIEKHPGYWPQDLSAATENILLAVRALGLGGVWLGVYPREARMASVIEALELPEGIIPMSIVPIGYTDVSQQEVDRYNTERVHRNKW